MKTMNPFLSLLLTLTFLLGGLSAQCVNHPPGVADVTAGGCNEISTGPVPRYSFFTLPSATQSVLVLAAINNVPDYPGAPAIFYGTVWFELSGMPSGVGIQIPGTSSPNCLWYTLPDIQWSPIVFAQAGCQSVPYGTVAPLSGLQGFVVFTQLALWDGVQNKWAVSRQIAFAVQP